MIRTFLLTALLTLGPAAIVRANIIVQLQSASLSGAPGDTLSFIGTLTNDSPIDQIWLNGIGSTSSSAFLNIDTTPFFIDAPLFLDPLETSAPVELFDVAIAAQTPPGPENGSFVSIQGGPDGGAGTAFNDLADISFDVNVSSSVSGIPEPSTWSMTLVALLLAALTRVSVYFAGHTAKRKTQHHREDGDPSLAMKDPFQPANLIATYCGEL